MASDFSPGEKDRKVEHAYFYEVTVLQGEPDYKPAYIAHLKTLGMHGDALNELALSAMRNPEKMPELKKLYADIYPEMPFKRYWDEKCHATLPAAPPFKLQALDGGFVELISFKGRWLLVDFWGTWCMPCVKDLPNVQKFYDKLGQMQTADLRLLTIACHDRPAAVITFMKEHKYTFPVVMSDEQVEKQYKVPGFPFKVLIRPDGTYFEIPFSREWQSTVQAYLDAEV